MDMIDRIKGVREDNDNTQRELAKELQINHVQWAKYESRKNEMPIRYLEAFCRHYNVSSDYILGLPKDLDWPR